MHTVCGTRRLSHSLLHEQIIKNPLVLRHSLLHEQIIGMAIGAASGVLGLYNIYKPHVQVLNAFISIARMNNIFAFVCL
jgi:hypothetical protein